jgi:tetraacyldisaccharide 4'-kinase
MVLGVGDPASAIAQISGAGAAVTASIFPDHHAFSDADAAAAAATATAEGAMVLCTLKDAVKLSGRWPHREVGLWYVSQRVIPEEGSGFLQALTDSIR